MRRFEWFVFFGLSTLALGGCSQRGNFVVSWQFWQFANQTGAVEPASDGCGEHGVDGIRVTGTSTSGAGISTTGLCTPGALRASVPTGTWTFTIQTVDVRGAIIVPGPGDPPDPTTESRAIGDGATIVFSTVTIAPRPECRDGIDNDGDGLIDEDDPGCANTTPETIDTRTESSDEGSKPDGGLTPDAGATPDAGGTPDAGSTADSGTTPDGGLTPEAGATTADGSTADAPASGDGPVTDGSPASD